MKLSLALLVLLAGFATLTYWRAQRTAVLAEQAYPPLGEIVRVNGTDVHYLTRGSGPDLVLIHGASGNLRDFSFALMDRLSDRYRVTGFDRPGLGYTGSIGHGASIAEQAALLAAASEQIGLERPLVLGQSYGGAVALAWALEHPASGLVLLSAASNPWETGLGGFYTALSSPPGQALMAPYLSAWVRDVRVTDTIACIFSPGAVPEGYIDYIGAPLTLRTSALQENALQRAGLLGEITAQMPRYSEIDMPVEILHGDTDVIVPHSVHSEPLSQQIPGAALHILENQGHMLQHTAQDEVIAAIDRAAARAGLR